MPDATPTPDAAADLARLRRLVDRANDLVQRPEVRDDAAAVLRELATREDLLVRGRPVAHALRPSFITKRQDERVRAAAAAVARACGHLGRVMLGDESLRRHVGFPEELAPALAVDAAATATRNVGRVDGVIDERGEYRALEYNAAHAGGVYFADVVSRMWDRSRLVAALRAATSIETQVTIERTARAMHAGGAHERVSVIGVVWHERVDLEKPWAYDIADVLTTLVALRREGIELVSGTPADVTASDGGVAVRGTRVDMLAVPPERVLVMAVLLVIASDHERYTRWLATGEFRFLNGISLSTAMATKSLLAVISDENADGWLRGLPRDTIAAARDAVPWTRVVRSGVTTWRGGEVDLAEHVARHREDLVMKPAFGLAGTEVVLGWNVSAEEWEHTLASGLASGRFVVQERVRPSVLPWPELADDGSVRTTDLASSVDTFAWNDREAHGSIARTMVNGLMNVAQGAQVVPVLVAGDDDR